VSGEIEGERYDLHAVTDGETAAASGVPHERALVALAEAVVGGSDADLTAARAAAVAALGPHAFVEAAAVAANFERMVRIADATGIQLDAPLDAVSAGLRADLGIDRFGSAANTPRSSAFRIALARALAPFARYFMSLTATASRFAARRAAGGAPPRA
jgi:hypothetical protein